MDAEPEDYVMCVQLFGGTHSPSTCNYVFRRTAADNKDQFGEDIANFHVDDMFKGVPRSRKPSIFITTVKVCVVLEDSTLPSLCVIRERF